MDEPTAPAAPAAPAPRISRVFAVALVLLAAIVAALWFDTRGRIGTTQEELARRLHDIETESRDARSAARQAQEGLREAQAKIGALEAKLAESQNQQLSLEALYQELARNRDEWQLAEIEQVLAIAQQQLQLSGNVRAALLALQLAESRLTRVDRPQFLPVRRALTRDIERLKRCRRWTCRAFAGADRLVAQVDACRWRTTNAPNAPNASSDRRPQGAAAPAAAAPPPRTEPGYLERPAARYGVNCASWRWCAGSIPPGAAAVAPAGVFPAPRTRSCGCRTRAVVHHRRGAGRGGRVCAPRKAGSSAISTPARKARRRRWRS
jgi:hypothetical protein